MYSKAKRTFRRYLYVVIFGWSALLALSLLINLHNYRSESLTNAMLVANAYLDKDLAFRRWLTMHGGVYVKPTERTPPNPYLKVPDRDVLTTGGKALTLVNPAYAMREVLEDFSEQYGIKGHLTSLTLMNPQNAPDPWEREALLRFEQGEKEVSATVDIKGAQALRLIRPVYMEKACLKCHSEMNIPVGGIRGGISTTVPLASFQAASNNALHINISSHLAIWLVGLLAIGFTALRNNERLAERLRIERIRRQDEQRIAMMLSLGERIDLLNENEIIAEGLEKAERLSDSQIAYFHFVNDDQRSIELTSWSQATLTSCRAVYDAHYPLDKAGIWADCARQHQPVVHNDYPAMARGTVLPEGHATLLRHLSVPVLETGKVRLIMGVGNKVQPYDEDDVRLLQMLADDLWKLLQRKRADSRLRASQRLLSEAQQVAKMGSWSYDLESHLFEWSDEIFHVCEVPPGSLAAGRDPILELLHPDDRERVLTQLQESVGRREPFPLLFRVVLPDGRIKTLAGRGQTFFNPDDSAQRITGTVHDITEHAEIESLRRSEANFTALIENTDRIIWSVDAQLRLVISNSSFHVFADRFFGRQIRAGDSTLPEGMSSDSAEKWRGYYQRALAGEKFVIEFKPPDSEDEQRWVNFSFFPIADDDGRIVGVTVFGHDFTERMRLEAAQFESFARMSKMVVQLETMHNQNVLINRLNDLIQSCHAESEAYDVIHLSLKQIFPGLSGCLALIESDIGGLHIVAEWGSGHGVPQEFGSNDCWSLRRGEAHEVAVSGEGLACQHFTVPPKHGYLCLPLVVRGELFGLFHLAYPADAEAATREGLRELARSVSETIKLSLSNLRLREAMQEQATHDQLTGLFNRRYLDSTLPRELHRAHRNRSQLAIAMIDIDYFKRFNDSFGHEAGDLVLQEIGAILRTQLRRSDIACRYGGEELLVIMPDSGAHDACEHLEEVRSLISNMKLQHHGVELPSITVSVGIAEAFVHGDEPKALLRASDIALYQAKNSGRDRIVVFAQNPPA